MQARTANCEPRFRLIEAEMKFQRHNAIRELMAESVVANQNELRRKLLALLALAVVAIVAFILIGRVLGGIILVAIAALAWRQYIWPRQKQRYLESIDERPSWEIEPD